MTRSRASFIMLAATLAAGRGWSQAVESTTVGGEVVAEVAARRASVKFLGYGDAKARAAAAGTITADEVRAPVVLPLAGLVGPTVLHVQILLDAARFTPGVVDGRWSENTSLALRAFRESQGLPDGDRPDSATMERLRAVTGGRDPLTHYTISAADVRGPFRTIPSGIYAKARMDCLCYQSALEMLSERFHTTPDVLKALNPDVDFAAASSGTALVVPSVDRVAMKEPPARLEVDRAEGAMRGIDMAGRLVFWLPTTVGSAAEPSPKGLLRIVSIQRDPHYHFNPRVLGDVPDSQADAMIAPGPNSPIGVMWMQLSRAHVGIHGTADPDMIGYARSHGCVRVTNWDARWLADMLRPGVGVMFR